MQLWHFLFVFPSEWTDSPVSGRRSLPPRHSWPSESPGWGQNFWTPVYHWPPLSQADAVQSSRSLQLAHPNNVLFSRLSQLNNTKGEKSWNKRQNDTLENFLCMKTYMLCLPRNFRSSYTNLWDWSVWLWTPTIFFHISANMPPGCLWICCTNHSSGQMRNRAGSHWLEGIAIVTRLTDRILLGEQDVDMKRDGVASGWRDTLMNCC